MSKLDLTKLTKEQKLEMLDMIEERARRKREAPDNYIPNSGQLQVHRSQALERYCFSGNGSGKSCMLVNEVLWAAHGYNPVTQKHSHVPAKILVILDNPSKVEDVFLKEIKKWYNLKPEQLEKKGKPYYSRINFENGSTVDFVFHLQEEMTAESIEWHWAFFDEPCGRKLYVALKRGGRSKQQIGRILLIGTPIAASWLRKDVYEPWSKGDRPNTECFRFSTHVNKHNLADGYLEDFSSVLTEKERRIRLHGEFFDLEGLALAHLFDRATHVVPRRPWPTGFPVVIAIDPHPRKRHHAIMVGVSHNNDLVVIKELASKSAPSEFAIELKNWYQGFRVIDIVCDSFGSADLTGGEGRLSFIQVLKDRGIRVRATTYNEKQDEAFIQMIQEVLLIPAERNNFGQALNPRLTIFEGNTGIIADIESVEWQKYRNIDEFKPKLGIENKDFLACLKYALATQPRFEKRLGARIHRPQAPVSWSQKARKRLSG